MKTFKVVAITAGGLVATFVVVGLLLPARWQVARSIVIDAPPAAIYPLVANFKTGWLHWSAFEATDPTIQYIYSGPDEGVGAKRTWTSQKMASGFQTITKANPQTGV